MKITVLFGSPNSKGSTSILVSAFQKGAEEKGHSVDVVNVTRLNIHPCTGCVHCGYEGPCVQKDDMEDVRERLLSSDMVVFATPLYYYGMSTQLKTVVDRFCSFNLLFQESPSSKRSERWRGMEEPKASDIIRSGHEEMAG